MPDTLTLKLAHINDTHSHFEPSRIQFTLNHQHEPQPIYVHTGGCARIKAQLDKARNQAEQNGQEFIFLHGGDSFQGTLYFREFQGEANATLLNQLQPDAMVLGNHEIDGGNGPVREFLDRINFPLLAGNMDLTAEPDSAMALKGHKNLKYFQPEDQCADVIIREYQGTQVAIFGITLDMMRDIARPDPGTEFINAQQVTQNTVAKLHQQGIVHIIVLSHLGLPADKMLAEQVDGISLIVGGHSHTLQGDFSALGLSNIPYGAMVNDTPIVHAGKYSETIGLADITFDHLGRVTHLTGNNYFMLSREFSRKTGQPFSQSEHEAITKQLQQQNGILWDDEDAAVAQLIQTRYRPSIDALENQIIALVPNELVHSRLPSKLLPNGSQLAPWVGRAMYKAAKQQDSRIDFALHNAGGVRQSLSSGALSMADVLGRMLPFELPLVTYQIRGRFLYEVLESAINTATNNSVVGTGTGSFPYTYGLRYSYDGRKPIGQRITKLEVMQQKQWRPLQPDSLYTGVSTTYTAAGKEGYQPLLQMEWSQIMSCTTLPGAFAHFVTDADAWQEPLPPNVHYTSHMTTTEPTAQLTEK